MPLVQVAMPFDGVAHGEQLVPHEAGSLDDTQSPLQLW